MAKYIWMKNREHSVPNFLTIGVGVTWLCALKRLEGGFQKKKWSRFLTVGSELTLLLIKIKSLLKEQKMSTGRLFEKLLENLYSKSFRLKLEEFKSWEKGPVAAISSLPNGCHSFRGSLITGKPTRPRLPLECFAPSDFCKEGSPNDENVLFLEKTLSSTLFLFFPTFKVLWFLPKKYQIFNRSLKGGFEDNTQSTPSLPPLATSRKIYFSRETHQFFQKIPILIILRNHTISVALYSKFAKVQKNVFKKSGAETWTNLRMWHELNWQTSG